ncbi:putative formamidase [Pseudocercospora fuligena]|uniref:Putative formamidase n=1 Tax=Pseudocercospora fuligena TaxID=685502 RepID=A0A8H6RTB8_9PEZI|nr:putative formamidase [Pseudocercospora fuligena]
MAGIRKDSHQCHSIHRGQKHLKWSNKQPPVLTVDPGDVVTFDCIDGGNGQIKPSSTADAILNFDVTLADPVFGPVYVEGAEPGDALEVEVLDLQTGDWGWTAVIPNFGLLAEDFPEANLKIWSLPTDGSRLAHFNDDIRIPIRPFMGTMGVAPGEDGEFSTIPPLETGGNIDTRHITKGSKLILPVRAAGALFSCGDGHAAQGDGEVCGSAIETPMRVSLRFNLRKQQPWVQSPHFECPPKDKERVLPDCGTYNAMGVDSNMLEASRKAVRAMLEYLQAEKGMSKIDAYMLCSVAVSLRFGEVVDMPNYAIFASLPLNVFASSRPGTNGV